MVVLLLGNIVHLIKRCAFNPDRKRTRRSAQMLTLTSDYPVLILCRDYSVPSSRAAVKLAREGGGGETVLPISVGVGGKGRR